MDAPPPKYRSPSPSESEVLVEDSGLYQIRPLSWNECEEGSRGVVQFVYGFTARTYLGIYAVYRLKSGNWHWQTPAKHTTAPTGHRGIAVSEIEAKSYCTQYYEKFVREFLDGVEE